MVTSSRDAKGRASCDAELLAARALSRVGNRRGRARLAQRVVVLKPLIAWLVVWVNVAAGCVGG